MTEPVSGHVERLLLAGPPPLYVPLLVLIAIGTAGYSALRGERLGCALLALLGFGWLRVDKPFEGDILMVLSPTHGITEADLLSPLCLVLAGGGWVLSQWLQRGRPGLLRPSSSGPGIDELGHRAPAPDVDSVRGWGRHRH